jgi:hypothetical protein
MARTTSAGTNPSALRDNQLPIKVSRRINDRFTACRQINGPLDELYRLSLTRVVTE